MEANVTPKLDYQRGAPCTQEIRMMAGLGVERRTLSQALRPSMKQADESYKNRYSEDFGLQKRNIYMKTEKVWFEIRTRKPQVGWGSLSLWNQGKGE